MGSPTPLIRSVAAKAAKNKKKSNLASDENDQNLGDAVISGVVQELKKKNKKRLIRGR